MIFSHVLYRLSYLGVLEWNQTLRNTPARVSTVTDTTVNHTVVPSIGATAT